MTSHVNTFKCSSSNYGTGTKSFQYRGQSCFSHFWLVLDFNKITLLQMKHPICKIHQGNIFRKAFVTVSSKTDKILEFFFFLTGYFVHDATDIIFSGHAKGSWEFLLHHALVRQYACDCYEFLT